MANKVSELFDESIWQEVSGFEGLTDITYHQHVSLGVVRIAFNRPEVRNAFRPQTVDELANALTHAQAIPRLELFYLPEMALLLKMVVGLFLLVEIRRFVVVKVMSMGILEQLLAYTFLKFRD